MAALLGVPVSLPQIVMAAIAAWLFVLSVWFEVWHRREIRRINEYRVRFRLRYERRGLDEAYLAVRELAPVEIEVAA